MVWGTLLAALTATAVVSSLEHDYVRPLPGSRVVADDERDGELVLTYRDAGSRVRRTIAGRVYSIEYEISSDVTAEKVVGFFTEQAEGLDGGDVHRTTENRLTFSFRRKDGGTTWCEIWATDGNYTLELVDEAPGADEPEPETAREPAPAPAPAPSPPPPHLPVPVQANVVALVFDEAIDALPPGAGAILDDVATRLSHDPTSRLEIRARGDRGRQNAETVRAALVLFGIAHERLSVVSAESRDDEDANRLELALLQ